MKKISLLILLLSAFTLTGCGTNNTTMNSPSAIVNNGTINTANTEANMQDATEANTIGIVAVEANTDTEEETAYQTISPVTAKEMMDASDDLIILDVRTKEEYDAEHIENAILLPVTQILEKAEDTIKNKDTVILVYCRSGNRSATAAAELATLGYTNVYDFGGIIDWTYETVTE